MRFTNYIWYFNKRVIFSMTSKLILIYFVTRDANDDNVFICTNFYVNRFFLTLQISLKNKINNKDNKAIYNQNKKHK